MLDPKVLELLAKRVSEPCKQFNDPNLTHMGKDWAWAELVHDALPKLEEYISKSKKPNA